MTNYYSHGEQLWPQGENQAMAEAAQVDEDARLDPDEVLAACRDLGDTAELELLAFDDEEVAGRLEILGYPLELVDAVKAAAARALPGDDPGPY
jgi:hypothetical protein